ncbi:MAG: cold-shock protein [Clostridia bacterium]|jgi:CspA family cold shock protein|nr:cold-shock protein [Clostridia bacterium]
MSEEKVYRGTVKSYNEKRGYGFIAREDNQGDLFFHVSDLLDRDYNPQRNHQVEFEVAKDRKDRQKAIQVKRVVK